MDFKKNELDAAFDFIVGFEGCFDRAVWSFRTGEFDSSDFVSFCEDAKVSIDWIDRILEHRTWNSKDDVLKLGKVQQEFRNLISFKNHLHIDAGGE